jgi:Uma2 family endonuclease
MQAPTTAPDSPDDPFRYGWRYVKVTRPDGTEDFDQIPLTLEDLLFPQEGDFPMQTDMHDEDCLYLKTVFKARLADDSTAIVLSDCRIDFNVEGLQPLGPDVAVLRGHKGPRKDWGTYYLASEGSTPALVVEITSPDTRANDVELKFEYYHQARVPLYLIADIRTRGGTGLRRLKLSGYRWMPDGYEPIPADAQGRLRLPELNVSLGKKTVDVGERVACFDPDTGEEIGDYDQISNDLKQSRAAADKARTDAAEAEARAAEAEARAAEAEARAAEAEVKAAEEARLRLDLEARLQEMEARLRSQQSS